MNPVFVERNFLVQLKEQVISGSGEWEVVRFELRRKAQSCYARGPWSVTNFPAAAPSGDPHDFCSEAPYWWPDPSNPGGPYIRKDGVTRTDRFMGHRKSLDELSDTVLYLCSAGYLLDEDCYLERAAELVRTFFLDPATRMNPHLEYGEAIPGICNGRAAGIIALRQVDKVVHAMGYAADHPAWGTVLAGMKDWLSELLAWLTTSRIGLDESRSGNNHEMWWYVHTAAYASFTDNTLLLEEAFEHFRAVILPEQLTQEGSMPREIERTRSFHYSLFNLDAFALLCEIAHHHGVDLWQYRTPEGVGMETAVRFVLPYLDIPYLWRHEQLDGEIPGEQLSLQLAGLRLGIEECRIVNSKRRGEARWIPYREEKMGPFVFWPGHYF